MTIIKPLKAMIVGCGSIGALKLGKYDKPAGKHILTHAHAYKVSQDIELYGVVDTDEDKAKQAAKKWGTRRSNDVKEALNDWKPDVVSVCVPTEHHYKVLDDLIDPRNRHRPRLVVIEKPFCSSLEQVKKITRKYQNLNIPILVNYTRRFSLEYDFLYKRIQRGLLGKIHHARLLYGRGLLRDGCHGLDVFNWFLGNVTGIIVESSIVDFLPEDPSVSMMLTYELCNSVEFVAVDSNDYGIFEMEFVAEKEIVRLTENGLWLNSYYPKEETLYGKYKSMPGAPSHSKQTDLTNCLSRMLLNAARHLLHGEPLQCISEDAIKIHTTIDAVNQVNKLAEKEKKKRCLH